MENMKVQIKLSTVLELNCMRKEKAYTMWYRSYILIIVVVVDATAVSMRRLFETMSSMYHYLVYN